MAVQYTLQPVLPIPNTRTSDPPRPFTSVNLCLRPPSSEPQPPIEIQSGQSITYSTTSFDPNKGFQSQLQIRIGPGKYLKHLISLFRRKKLLGKSFLAFYWLPYSFLFTPL